MNRKTYSLVVSTIAALCVVTAAFCQTATELPPVSATSAPPNPSMDAEREQIWNSPTMLRARAWVQEYCQRSAQVSPEEAKQYMTELQNLTPIQMKLWLLKFNHEEQMIRSQQAAFNASRQADVGQARSVNAATQQAFARINQDESAAAQSAEQSISQEAQFAQQRDLQQNDARDEASSDLLTQPLYYGSYGLYPGDFAPMGLGGGYHIHVHVHPR